METVVAIVTFGFLLIARSVCDQIVPEALSVKECHVNQATYFHDARYHWNQLRTKYSGCTHVMGNLDISFLDDDTIEYDLSFLENIRYVSGYVAIFANKYPAVVPLPKLEVIRGNGTFSTGFADDFALLIGANDHEQVYMPRLKEVSRGSLLLGLDSAPNLCYLDTIDWSSIVRDGEVLIRRNDTTPNPRCASCSPVCHVEGRGSRCWGPTDDLCQWEPVSSSCDSTCGTRRCVTGDSSTCCHDQCAIGCAGPTERDCFACKDFQLPDGTCVSHCPIHPQASVAYRYGQDCIPI